MTNIKLSNDTITLNEVKKNVRLEYLILIVKQSKQKIVLKFKKCNLDKIIKNSINYIRWTVYAYKLSEYFKFWIPE